MCTYLACLEREKSIQYHQQEQSVICGVNSVHGMETEMNPSQGDPQSNGTHHSCGGECSVPIDQPMDMPGVMHSDHDLNNQPATCSICHINWRLLSFTPGCVECGGFALIRSCPICNGHCGAVWARIIDMSNEMKTPYWDGTCHLSKEEQNAHMIRNWVNDDMDTLVDALSDLGTR